MSRAGRAASPGRTALGLLVAALGLLAWWWVQTDVVPGTGAPPETSSAQSSSPTHDPIDDHTDDLTDQASADPESGLPVVRLADLPGVAREAVARIDDGGPFPYDEDDGVFENREELLPDRPPGHYREYTVGGRPGARGPLRIVAGEDGELYWTEDHYRSFSRIVR